MNNVNIFTAPVYALFSRDFYRQVLKAPLSRGFLYLLYVAVLLTVLLYAMIFTVGLRQIDPLVDWAKQEMPPLVGTPQGFQMNVASPYVMVHPDFGPLVTFDMNATEGNEKTMGNIPLLITSTKMYIRTGEGEFRTIDLFSPEALKKGTQLSRNIRIDSTLIDKIYQAMKFWILALLFVVFIPAVFLLYLAQGLLCSLLGLLFNTMRAEKLGYAAILNASFFALTASILYGVLKGILPFLAFLPGGMFVSVLITGIYLFIFIKIDEEKPA